MLFLWFFLYIYIYIYTHLFIKKRFFSFFRSSFSQSSNTSLQSSFGSQQAESVKGFNSSDSLCSWHSTKTRFTSPSKLDSSFSSFDKPSLHRRTSSSSVSLNGNSWSPLSIKTNFQSFPLSHESSLPSFKSLSRASVNGDFASGQLSPRSYFSQPLSRSSFLSIDNKNHQSPYSQPGFCSLNRSSCSKEVHKNTPSSLTDNILGIKMNKISLGSSISHSQKSLSGKLSCIFGFYVTLIFFEVFYFCLLL